MLAEVQQAIGTRPIHEPLILLADFDGTLVEFAIDPASPVLSTERREWLQALESRRDTFVGLVSGRPIADLRARAPLSPSAYYAGLHGLEIDGPTRAFRHEGSTDARAFVAALTRALQDAKSDFPGAVVEPKGASVSFHVRGVVPTDRAMAVATADAEARPWIERGQLRRLDGHAVVEYLPNVAWNKGDAVRWIGADVAARAGRRGFVVFLGDDRSDEDAFDAVTHGIGVVVGNRPSRAAHRLPSIAHVDQLLRWLTDTR